MNPPHTPYAVPVRPAASVLILRERAARLEVFVQHRATTMDFAAGAVVFPGGRVDEIDRAIAQASNYPQQVLRDHTARWAHTSLTDTEESTAHRQAATVLAAALREVPKRPAPYCAPNSSAPGRTGSLRMATDMPGVSTLSSTPSYWIPTSSQITSPPRPLIQNGCVPKPFFTLTPKDSSPCCCQHGPICPPCTGSAP